ncbi:uncharacterized protein [Mytilus edulis]
MPGDISGPDLHLARPKTSPAAITRTGRRGKSKQEESTPEYHVELLEYEWPDLPPIPHMKDAITREKVSKGISYLLPIDKAKNSIDNKYRTDLRAMFQEPYANDDLGYDDSKVKLSAHVHFDTNAVDTKWSKSLLKQIPVEINSDSDKFRKLYARSAPIGRSKTMGLDTDKIRTRSCRYLPMKTVQHPEAMELRQEVEKIIRTVYSDNEDSDVETEVGDTNASRHGRRFSLYPRRVSEYRPRLNTETDSYQSIKPPRLKLTADKFNSYEQLKFTKPPKAVIPELFICKHIKKERAQEIWEWLHYGEEMSEFEYFLSVCG